MSSLDKNTGFRELKGIGEFLVREVKGKSIEMT